MFFNFRCAVAKQSPVTKLYSKILERCFDVQLEVVRRESVPEIISHHPAKCVRKGKLKPLELSFKWK